MLIDDVAALAHIFGNVMDAPFLRLRLDVITTKACRKCHTNELTARLICTYRGTGTQYGVPEESAKRQDIRTASNGSAIVRRGHQWPARNATVHRSGQTEHLRRFSCCVHTRRRKSITGLGSEPSSEAP